MKRIAFALVAVLLTAQVAVAQWQVPFGSIPIGRGPGVVGFTNLTPGADGTCIIANGGVWTTGACGSGSGDITIGVTNVFGGSTTNILYNNGGKVGEFSLATAAQRLAGTANKIIEGSTIYLAETVVTYGTTTSFNFATFLQAGVTLTGNITTMNVSNVTAGRSGTIAFIQDGTGSRTTVFNSVFKFPGGAVPTLTTTASAVDILSYACRTATFCTANLLKDVK